MRHGAPVAEALSSKEAGRALKGAQLLLWRKNGDGNRKLEGELSAWNWHHRIGVEFAGSVRGCFALLKRLQFCASCYQRQPVTVALHQLCEVSPLSEHPLSFRAYATRRKLTFHVLCIMSSPPSPLRSKVRAQRA
jgi:hypothetical protein